LITPLVTAEVTQHGRRRPTPLTLSLAGVRAAMAELAAAERMLLAAEAARDAAPPAPEEAQPASPGAPLPAAPGEPRCEDYSEHGGEGWLCTARRGHPSPAHAAHGPGGEVMRAWAAADGTPAAAMPGPLRAAAARTRSQAELDGIAAAELAVPPSAALAAEGQRASLATILYHDGRVLTAAAGDLDLIDAINEDRARLLRTWDVTWPAGGRPQAGNEVQFRGDAIVRVAAQDRAPLSPVRDWPPEDMEAAVAATAETR